MRIVRLMDEFGWTRVVAVRHIVEILNKDNFSKLINLVNGDQISLAAEFDMTYILDAMEEEN